MRLILLSAITVTLLSGLEENIHVEVTEPTVTLSKTSINIPVLGTEKISISDLIPGDKVLSWKSRDPAIAEVKDGTITGKKPGYTTITVTLLSGLEKDIYVEITEPTISLSKSYVSIKVNETANINVSDLVPGDRVISWESSDPAIAEVKDGTITGKKPGDAAIIVTLLSGLKEVVDVEVTSLPILDPPYSLKAVQVSNGIKITWNKPVKAESFEVYRETGNSVTQVATTTSNTFTDTKTVNGTTYKYFVKASASGYTTSGKSASVTIVRLTVPTNPKAKAGKKKQATITWKKNAKATGYQIRYSLKSNMKSAKTITVKKAKTVKQVVKNLKSKKTYYFQIRAYKKVGGKTYYSVWSGNKKVKVK